MSGECLADGRPAPGAGPALTPRQREILRLLCEGKVNKEIARELGIGVGTVKQHVVALFKRLNVRNRAMAVSHGMALLEAEAARPGAGTGDPRGLVEEGILVRRPCVVLSVALPADASFEAARHLHRTLAGLAYDGEALFLAREGGAGDLLFGVRRASEHDLVAVLQLAVALHKEMAEREPLLADRLRGGLGAGMAIVSKRRHGGWSGEAVASPVIAGARKRLHGCAPGELGFDATVGGVMESFGLQVSTAPSGCIPFSRLGDLFRLDAADDEDAPLGRDEEWRRIDGALSAGEGRLLRLEGETGMGKSRLCRAAAARCRALGGRVVYLRGLPVVAAAPLCDTADGRFLSAPEVEARLDLPVTGTPELWVVDDFHLLSAGLRGRLAARAEVAVVGGRVVVLAGRRVNEAPHSNRIHLRRLDDAAIDGLLRRWGGEAATHRTKEAAGVPLFAVELARAPSGEPPLPLVMTVATRLDGFSLDWKLLLTLAQSETAMSTVELAEAMGETSDQVSEGLVAAIRAGVLALIEAAPEERVGFHHPLIRRVVALLGVEWGLA